MSPRTGLFTALLVLLAACASTRPAGDQGARGAPAVDAVASDAARQVVVTFADRSLSRPPNGSPGPYLERGASYGSTTWSRGISGSLAKDHRLTLITEWPILSLGVHCVVYAVDDSRTLTEVIGELGGDARVGTAQAMATFHVLAADPYQPLQTSFRGMNAERARQLATGRGVSIAIVDTGVDLRHPDLAGQIASHLDLAEAPRDLAFNDDIHGTAVAGVIGALAGNGQGIVGMAPDARLYALRACWPLQPGEPGAICNSLSLATALDAAIRLQPRIINLSLTGPADPLIQSLLRQALARQIVVVIAEPPAGERPSGFASGLDAVIRVRMAGQAPAADETEEVVAAPGHEVLTTFPRGSYNFISGGSFAAANVSGLVALLLELKPGLDAAAIHDALRAGLIGGAGGSSDGVDACAVISSLRLPKRCAAA